MGEIHVPLIVADREDMTVGPPSDIRHGGPTLQMAGRTPDVCTGPDHDDPIGISGSDCFVVSGCGEGGDLSCVPDEHDRGRRNVINPHFPHGQVKASGNREMSGGRRP